MHRILASLSFAAGIGLVCCQSAGAVAAGASNLAQAATAPSRLQQVQYEQRRTRHGVVKCYRDFVIGPYRCHHYRNGVVSLPF